MTTTSISTRLSRLRFGFCLLMAGTVLWTGCAGGGNVERPEWLKSYPADSAYYIGIGGSRTGNLAEDRDKAAAAARADLAAQISSQVSSELNISSRFSSNSGVEESVERGISESVEQNLRSVEVVDSWISPEEGAWVYVRLSRAVWAAIVSEETAALTARTNAIAESLLSAELGSAEKMAALGRARAALLESPWGLRVDDRVFGSGGLLLDAVDSEVSALGAELTLSASVTPSRFTYGTEVTLSGRVVSDRGDSMNSYPLAIQGAGEETLSLTTRADGSFSLSFVPKTETAGTMRLEVMPDLSAWNLPVDGFPTAKASVDVFVEPVLLEIEVLDKASPDLASLNRGIEDWISSLPMPVEVVPSGGGTVILELTWTVEDASRAGRSANAPYISEVGAVISVSKAGNVLFTQEIDAFKDGGSGWPEAHQRAGRGFLENAAEDDDLTRELIEVLGR